MILIWRDTRSRSYTEYRKSKT